MIKITSHKIISHRDSPAQDEVVIESPSAASPTPQMGFWSPEEDAALVNIVNRHRDSSGKFTGSWNKVCLQLQEEMGIVRTEKSCRTRYQNHLREDIRFTALNQMTPSQKKYFFELLKPYEGTHDYVQTAKEVTRQFNKKFRLAEGEGSQITSEFIKNTLVSPKDRQKPEKRSHHKTDDVETPPPPKHHKAKAPTLFDVLETEYGE